MSSSSGPKPEIFVEVGQRFGGLVVIDADARTGITPAKPKGWRAAICRCECGNTTVAKISALIHGHKKSCGLKCDYSPGKMSARTPEGRARAAGLTRSLSAEQEAKRRTGSTRHGFASRGDEHPLFRIWHQMLGRCENPATPNYARYGGRGIAVCPQWHDLARFIADIEAEIGPRPEEYVPGRKRRVYRYSLDRYPDRNGNYEPGNVRWATAAEQQANIDRPEPSQCSEDGCPRIAKSRGMCDMHYKRWRKAQQPSVVRQPKERAECSEDSCAERSHALGMCRRHYQRQWARNRRKAA